MCSKLNIKIPILDPESTHQIGPNYIQIKPYGKGHLMSFSWWLETRRRSDDLQFVSLNLYLDQAPTHLQWQNRKHNVISQCLTFWHHLYHVYRCHVISNLKFFLFCYCSWQKSMWQFVLIWPRHKCCPRRTGEDCSYPGASNDMKNNYYLYVYMGTALQATAGLYTI